MPKRYAPFYVQAADSLSLLSRLGDASCQPRPQVQAGREVGVDNPFPCLGRERAAVTRTSDAYEESSTHHA